VYAVNARTRDFVFIQIFEGPFCVRVLAVSLDIFDPVKRSLTRPEPAINKAPHSRKGNAIILEAHLQWRYGVSELKTRKHYLRQTHPPVSMN